MDVVDLYPSIPHDKGLSTLRKRLNERDKKMSTDALAKLAELDLKNNIFNNNEKTSKQKGGTTIGTKFSLPYSILFMAEMEKKFFEKIDNKPCLWWRYIDDTFFIWEHGEEKLRNFVETFNEIHPTIKFTVKWSQKSINILNVTVSLIDSQIEKDLYVKPKDSYKYLHSSSCHTYTCKKNIPYSQALRLDQICSKNIFFYIHCNNLEK